MASNKKYWKSVEELNSNSSIVDTLKQNEFVEEIPTDEFLGNEQKLKDSSTTRRDFLKYVGFTTAAASLAACEGPVVKSIPYVVKPDDIIPGVADYYATTIADGFDFANILVKVREGRPIKIEPNKEANGTTNARIQASVLSLYDSHRLKVPTFNGEEISWGDVDTKVITTLEKLNSENLPIAILTSTNASPSTNASIEKFKEVYPTAFQVIYDAVSETAVLDAMEDMYGNRALPSYHFDKADVIVSVGADFLGDWQGGGNDASYAKGRVPKNGKMSRHIQFESNMTLTGANADERIMVKPSEQYQVLVKLYQAVVEGKSTRESTPINNAALKAAAEISKAGSKAIVLTGIQDKKAQLLVMALNKAIQSDAFDTSITRNVRKGDDKAVAKLIADMNAGNIGAVIINNANPVYSLPNAEEFVEGLKKVQLSLAFSSQNNETAKAVQFALPAPHYLEAWGDAEIISGEYSLIQPTIKPLFNTRQFENELLMWSANITSYYDFIKENWTTNVLGGSSWNQALHDGVFKKEMPTEIATNDIAIDVETIVNDISKITSNNNFELQLYTKTGMGDGQMANNPWLQEFPDPITRTSWDNYVTVSKADADALGIENYNVANGALNGSYVEVTVNNVTIIAPAYIQPGQAKGTIGLALGYGRKEGLKEEMQTGVNAYPLYQNFNLYQKDVNLKVAAGEHEFACIQLHNTLMGRGDIMKETTLADYNTKDAEVWNKVPVVSLDHNEVPAKKVDLWDSFDRSIGHHFNLSIDLNACNGCGACVISCHAENNVPVVGKDEIRKSRDMHWLRIDRYYSHEESFEQDVVKKEEGEAGYKDTMAQLEDPSTNPSVAFQPVMCQHCNHAPCETVCPVAATSHGRQGQNQMAYNRCVGTRYCANNCPYKVRRFNWFKYPENSEFDYYMNDDLGKMVLNPDVTVRTRGVMEKCSMCIQMTQATILKAKNEGRRVETNAFETACANACPTGALVFGDVNNEEDAIVEKVKDERAYHLLEHVGTRPNVVYQVKVKNTNEA